MRRIREFYDRYPTITVRLIFFLGGTPIICVVYALIHELFGKQVYQYLYAPLLAAVASAYFFILRKATLYSIQTDVPWSIKHRLYSFYSGVLLVLSVLSLFSSVCGFLGLI
ncbi:MAG: hypothetical protein IJE17_10065 [Clostridia bacterium]|nr:hypothetical protein [Clostridia bacterium]